MPKPLVLLVEDDRRLCATISDLLELLDIDCMVASGDMTSRVRLIGIKPDLVLLDMPLHSRSALDIMTDIQVDYRLSNTKAVLISSDECEHAPEYRLADAILRKPFVVEELETTLCRLLGHHRIIAPMSSCTTALQVSCAQR